MKDRKPNGRSRFWLGRLPRQRFQETDGLPKIVASGERGDRALKQHDAGRIFHRLSRIGPSQLIVFVGG